MTLQKVNNVDSSHDSCTQIKIPECEQRVRKKGMACDAVVRRVVSSFLRARDIRQQNSHMTTYTSTLRCSTDLYQYAMHTWG